MKRIEYISYKYVRPKPKYKPQGDQSVGQVWTLKREERIKLVPADYVPFDMLYLDSWNADDGEFRCKKLRVQPMTKHDKYPRPMIMMILDDPKDSEGNATNWTVEPWELEYKCDYHNEGLIMCEKRLVFGDWETDE